MHDVSTFGANDPPRLGEFSQQSHQAEAAALHLDGNHAKPFGVKPFTLTPNPRRDDDLKSALSRGSCHRQKVRNKEPVFGNDVEKLRHYDGRPKVSTHMP